MTPTAAIAALQYAMEVWNNAGSSFRFQYGGTAVGHDQRYDNRNVVIFRNASNGSAIATTYSWWNSSKQLLDSDIVMWDGAFTFYTGTSGCGGHLELRLYRRHRDARIRPRAGPRPLDATDATMYPSYSYCSQAFRTLAADDIAGVRALYPGGCARPTRRPPSRIGSPANGATFRPERHHLVHAHRRPTRRTAT